MDKAMLAEIAARSKQPGVSSGLTPREQDKEKGGCNPPE